MPDVIEQPATTTPAAEPSYTPPADDPTASSVTSEPEPATKVEKPVDKPIEKPESKIKLPESIKGKIPAKTGRFQERISDLVAQRNNAEREAAQLRDQVSRMTTPPKKGDGTAPAKGEKEDDLNPEDFDTYADFVKELTLRTMTKQKEADKSAEGREAYARHQQERHANFNEKAAPFIAEYEGFMDAITDPNLPISEAMADAVLELDDMGPYLMLYLAANRDKAAAIAKMNPRAATMAIGRLAAQLDYEIKGGTGTVEGGTDTKTGEQPPQTTTPVAPQVTAPKPTVVPIPRGSTPASLDGSPEDKDDVDTWLRKETDRLRRQNPNARFYGAR